MVVLYRALMMMVQVAGNFLNLIDKFCPVGAAVDFDKAYDVGVGFPNEFHDLVYMCVRSSHITGGRTDIIVIGLRGTCPISYIVNKDSHKNPPPGSKFPLFPLREKRIIQCIKTISRNSNKSPVSQFKILIKAV
jgi:hypothetical protein